MDQKLKLADPNLLSQMVNCRNCAEAMRMIAETLDPKGRDLALGIAEHYAIAAALIEELKSELDHRAV
jgi:hypothetical protein